MALWPFAGGKKQETTPLQATTPRNMAQGDLAGIRTTVAGRPGAGNRKDQAMTKTTLSQPARSQTATNLSASKNGADMRPTSQRRQKGMYQQAAPSQSSLGPENLTVISGPPTLFARRADSASQTSRQKSSKRKAEDSAREKEIRAMASSPIPIPKRPANYRSESPLAMEKRQVPAGVNRRFERQSSEISLPLASSFSNLEFASSQNGFSIGILAALSPRPHIRYDAQPPNTSGKQSIRRGMAIQKAIEEEDVSDMKRIDELADDLDAGGLRELMERDRKRREKKREADKVRLQQKLERRAARVREEETRKARTEAYVRESSPANVVRRSNRRTDSPSAHSLKEGVQATVPKSGAPSVSKPQNVPIDSDAGPSKPVLHTPIRNPFEDEEEIPGTRDGSEHGEPDVPLRSPLRPEHRTLGPQREGEVLRSPPVSPANQSADRTSFNQEQPVLETTEEDTEQLLADRSPVSDRSNVRLSTWTTFFSRGTRRRLATPTHGRQPPTEFSNISRESIQRKQLPPVVTEQSFRRSSSGTPQRATSKFREDLPELPISPPDSRVQSPIRIIDATSGRIRDDERDDLDDGRPFSEIELIGANAVPVQLSRSMASVDSEASWLSGRPSKRVSDSLANAARRSYSSLQRSPTGGTEREEQDGGNARDSFPARTSSLRPAPPSEDPAGSSRDATSEAQKSHDLLTVGVSRLSEEGAQPSDLRKRPNVVSPGDRIKSSQGLLNEPEANPSTDAATQAESSGEEAAHDEDESPGSVEIIDAPIMRVQSVNYKGHARAVSAGSAKLLEIRRTSTHSDLGRPRSPTLARKSGLGLNHPDDSSPATPTTVD